MVYSKIAKLLILALLAGLVLFLLLHFLGLTRVASAEIKQPGFGTTTGIIPNRLYR